MPTERPKRKFKRLFLAADLHGSEITFRKFLAAATFYEVDALLIGGDLTAKSITPIVQQKDGRYQTRLAGAARDNLTEAELEPIEKAIADSGPYPVRMTEDEYARFRANPEKVESLFTDRMIDQIRRWTQMAERHLAQKLDATPAPPRPVLRGGQQVLIPVGSTTFRSAILETQPVLGLHGHIHETKNAAKLKRTVCVDPGSEYSAGTLRGAIINLERDRVLSYQFTTG